MIPTDRLIEDAEFQAKVARDAVIRAMWDIMHLGEDDADTILKLLYGYFGAQVELQQLRRLQRAGNGQ